MASLVIELQQMAESTANDVPTLLRRAIVVASKLKLDDFEEWFEHELNGYAATSAVPDYRVVPSQLMSRRSPNPPQPVGFYGEVAEGEVNLAQHLSKLQVRQPVGQVAHLVGLAARDSSSSGFLHLALGEGEMKAMVADNEDFAAVELFRSVSSSTLVAILDAVRNRILKWSLDLERKGIMGEGMTFTKEEQKAASQVTINGSVGSFVQGEGATVAAVQNSPGANVTVATAAGSIGGRIKGAVDAVRKLNPPAAEAIERLADGIARLPEEKKSEAAETLAVIAEQAALSAEQRLQKVVLTPVVSSLRDNLSLSADLLQIWSTFGPVIAGWLGLILK